MTLETKQTTAYHSLGMPGSYAHQADRIKQANARMQSDGALNFSNWGKSNADVKVLAPAGSPLSNFLALVESQFNKSNTEDKNRLRDGDEGYTRAGKTNVVISDSGRLFSNGRSAVEAANERFLAQNHYRVLGSTGNDNIHAGNNSEIASGEGNDRARVGDNAVVYTGDGHDSVIVGQNATVFLGDGNDYAGSGEANNRIDGGGGDDFITSGENSTLFGKSGDDHLGARDNSVIDAGSGDDRIFTGKHALVRGGTGNDYIRMSDNSTVLFDRGGGWDVLESHHALSIGSGTLSGSRVQFGPGIAATDLDIVQRGPHLVISIRGTEDALVIRNVAQSKVPDLQFIDGTVLEPATTASMTSIDNSPLDERLKTAGNKKMLGSESNDTLSNLAHADVWAGAGDDRVSVASESTVHFGRGDGHDVLTGQYTWLGKHMSKSTATINRDEIPAAVDGDNIYEAISADNASGRLDTSRVLLGADITPDDVAFIFEGNNLVITIKDSGETLTIPDMGRVPDPSHIRPNQVAPNVEFADGTYWTSRTVMTKADAATSNQ